MTIEIVSCSVFFPLPLWERVRVRGITKTTYFTFHLLSSPQGREKMEIANGNP